MRSSPAFHYRLRARSRGSFGNSAVGQFAEAVTLSWRRFEIFLLWLGSLALAFAIPDKATALLTILISPLLAVSIWLLVKMAGWLLYFVPGVNKAIAWARIAFLFMFSRLIIEKSPQVEIPAWHQP